MRSLSALRGQLSSPEKLGIFLAMTAPGRPVVRTQQSDALIPSSALPPTGWPCALTCLGFPQPTNHCEDTNLLGHLYNEIPVGHRPSWPIPSFCDLLSGLKGFCPRDMKKCRLGINKVYFLGGPLVLKHGVFTYVILKPHFNVKNKYEYSIK